MQYIKYVCRNVLDPLEMKRDENPSLKLFAFNSHAHIHENWKDIKVFIYYQDPLGCKSSCGIAGILVMEMSLKDAWNYIQSLALRRWEIFG